MLLGTGMLVFNVLGLSISVGDFAPQGSSVAASVFGIHGTFIHAWHLDLWTLPQRIWMTIGCLLIVAGRLLDARFLCR